MKRVLGKYTSTTYSGQLVKGFHTPITENIALIPVVGVRYTRFKDKGYK